MSVKITSTGGISALGGLSSTQVNNYFACNVGIGINKPAYALTIDNGDLLVCMDNGGYFQADESADAVKHSDNVKAMFGTGNDLQIYHNETNSFIDDGGAGSLFIRGSQINFNKYTGETMAQFVADGSVSLNYDNVKKFETTCVGVKATGAICGTGNLDIDGHSTLMGNLSVRGTVTCIDTRIETTSAIEVQNAGTGPAILANQLGSQPVVDFQDDGTSAFYIEDGGNVGIGLTDPTSPLHVEGPFTISRTGVTSHKSTIDMDGNFRFAAHSGYSMTFHTDEANVGCTEIVRFRNDTGNVGIGNTEAGQKLTVSGNISASGSLSATGAGYNWFASRVGIGDGTSARKAAAELTVQDGEVQVGLGATKGYDFHDFGTGWGYKGMTGPSRLGIFTDTAERITVGSGGCIGINCTGPSRTLDISGDAQVTTNLIVGTALYTNQWIANTSGPQYIKNNCAATSVAITNGGNVGIGTATPNETLTVQGKISATSCMQLGCCLLLTDAAQIRIGNAEDFRIYHSGTNNCIESHGGDIVVYNYDHGNDIVFCAENTGGTAAEYIRIDSSASNTCVKQNFRFADNVKAGFSTAQDMSICHTGSQGFIDNTTGILTICSADDFVVDAESDINLDACGGNVRIKVDGTTIGQFFNSSSDFVVKSEVNDKDLVFKGVDDSVNITALTLDMSDAGSATFNNKVCMGDGKLVLNGSAVDAKACELNLLDGCTSAAGIDCTGTTTASNSQTFTNKGGNISQWTNDCSYTDCAGSVTPSSCDTFTNKSGNISMWTNDCSYTGNTGTTTASNSQTFTNKSGNISQWTNDCSYTGNTGTTTASNSQTFTNKSGNISQWTNDCSYTTNTGTVNTTGTPVDNDFAKFTDADTIEGRSIAETKSDLSLNNVENKSSATIRGEIVSGNIPNNAADTTGNAATATALATARTIASVSFDGTGNISLNNNAITNGAGYTTNTGTITCVATAGGLTGGGCSGTVTVCMSCTICGCTLNLSNLPTSSSCLNSGDVFKCYGYLMIV